MKRIMFLLLLAAGSVNAEKLQNSDCFIASTSGADEYKHWTKNGDGVCVDLRENCRSGSDLYGDGSPHPLDENKPDGKRRICSYVRNRDHSQWVLPSN